MGQRTVFALIAMVALVSGSIVGSILGNMAPEQQVETAESYSDHMNNTIDLYCDLYRSSEERTRNTIKRELTRIMRDYYGRIDQHSEYCLNSMEVEYNR